MENHHIIIGIGFLLVLVGGIPAAIGTTSAVLFVLYGMLLVAGIALVGWGKKLGESAQNER